jgi:hypothetical protein
MTFHKTLTLTGAGFLLLLLSSCQTEDTVAFEYPMVMTLEADHITGNSARLNAVITDGPVENILEYGFVWGTTTILNVRDSEKVTAAGSPSASNYYADITFEQDPSEKYFVRSFIKSGELIIYGNLVSFNAPNP